MTSGAAHTVGASSNIRIRAIHADEFEKTLGYHDEGKPLSDDERAVWTRLGLREDLHVEAEHHVHNVTVRGLHAYLAEHLRRGSSENRSISHLSVGIGDSENATANATALGNELGRVTVSASEVQNGTELYTATYIGTNEFNGEQLTEVGLRLSNGVLANRAAIPPTPKTNVIGLTVEAIISFQNV